MTRPTTAQLNAAYDQFNFWYDKAKKLDEELAKAEERIAELESRTVKLPQAVSAGGQGYQEQVERILTAAGIKWEVE
ncbi:TPA: hypothetical protein ACTW3R_004901 [Klebsiella oxytoca]|uniref:hypothetical protein n=1 Tax=Klebsiella oxytoca TaxID=571 RepID=UPI00189A57E9|nr:hypothetical protein [Klebsiella oxytoca]EKT8243730.1 hypothetical protein [Klebsiella oxytoca]HAT4416052.1 hypothetical protein [Klebsiella oxytoca]HBU6148606.1 hypothetical protein [Klebsiella oxytoca]HBU6579328.1 hypothetical protein [Klebsiella oxytoca]HBV6742034.1 hypothetical protein [Klebsiella oxytoca]